MSKLTAEEIATKVKNDGIPSVIDEYAARNGLSHDGTEQKVVATIIRILARAVLDKPAPAGELGEILKLAHNRVMSCGVCKKPCSDCDLYEGLKFACHLLALAAENEQLKQDDWTAVEDGLPGEKQQIDLRWLTSNSDLRQKGFLYAGDWRLGTYSKKYPVMAMGNILAAANVTHWRPLPEPPEPDDE